MQLVVCGFFWIWLGAYSVWCRQVLMWYDGTDIVHYSCIVSLHQFAYTWDVVLCLHQHGIPEILGKDTDERCRETFSWLRLHTYIKIQQIRGWEDLRSRSFTHPSQSMFGVFDYVIDNYQKANTEEYPIKLVDEQSSKEWSTLKRLAKPSWPIGDPPHHRYHLIDTRKPSLPIGGLPVWWWHFP